MPVANVKPLSCMKITAKQLVQGNINCFVFATYLGKLKLTGDRSTGDELNVFPRRRSINGTGLTGIDSIFK